MWFSFMPLVNSFFFLHFRPHTVVPKVYAHTTSNNVVFATIQRMDVPTAPSASKTNTLFGLSNCLN